MRPGPGNPKLSAFAVIRLRSLRRWGRTLQSLADEFGLHNATVWKACEYRIHKRLG